MASKNESRTHVDDVQAKKPKLEISDNEALDLTGKSSLKSFKAFDFTEVLNEDAKQKFLFLHGKSENKDAVVLLEKTPFSTDINTIKKILSSETHLKETLKNDIYGTYEATIPAELNSVKATVIYPATEKHITKYKEQEMFVVYETEDLYNSVTLPHIESQKFSVQWVYNILDKKCESDRIVFEDCSSEDTGFILLPDMKWDRKDINSLYLQAIVHKHGIKSLRDLDQSHLPLLKNILKKSLEAVKEKFGVSKDKLRVYIHYLPSYYHLHVHITHVKLEAPGFEADHAHLLSDVIENIELCSDYYKQRTLTYKVREQDELYKRLKDTYFC
ncbi:hypothetical protein KUTeg_021019 [Tegillarca granosa]|uniref:m7GpppX diphosphatase n=1 Tax=Tegillarca granosa TaxID=220873 RepID=A0ABQ9E9N9_TEGGR|nr:hypothetical protein KUTeg_021019 [Tegillarca granosa]